ncbi:MAG: hypothetical protein IPJ98_06050 [Bryobacterales bacterium]|nr:hypothetical protein [Bryobacterales bacterium]
MLATALRSRFLEAARHRFQLGVFLLSDTTPDGGEVACERLEGVLVGLAEGVERQVLVLKHDVAVHLTPLQAQGRVEAVLDVAPFNRIDLHHRLTELFLSGWVVEANVGSLTGSHFGFILTGIRQALGWLLGVTCRRCSDAQCWR